MSPAHAAYPVRTGKAPHASANHRSEWKRPPSSSRLYAGTMKAPAATKTSSSGSKVERDRDSDRARGRHRHERQRDQHAARDLRSQRPPVQLVERVRPDPHCQRESEHGEAQSTPRDDGCKAAADDDVREMPRGVGRMQQRHVVAPAARRECVPGRPHARRPQITTPPPSESRRAWTCASPAARQSASCRSSGYALQKSRIDPPRKRPTSYQPGPEQQAGGGKRHAHPRLPRKPPEAARHAELERGDGPARPDDPRQLAQRRRRIVDVAEEVRERSGGRTPPRGRAAPRPKPRPGRRCRRSAAGRGQHLGLWSSPVTRKPQPEQLAATSPVPVATSSTRPRSTGRRETRKWRQRGSCPRDSTAPTRS